MQFGDPENSTYTKFIEEVGALAMGSATYEWLLEHLSEGENKDQPRWPYTQPTWIFTSRNLPTIEGADLRFARGDVRPVHEEMAKAASGKNLWIIGGGELAGKFYDQGLLDELIVTIVSVTLGAGFPLLPRFIAKPPLQLISAAQLTDAFVELRYLVPRQAGES